MVVCFEQNLVETIVTRWSKQLCTLMQQYAIFGKRWAIDEMGQYFHPSQQIQWNGLVPWKTPTCIAKYLRYLHNAAIFISISSAKRIKSYLSSIIIRKMSLFVPAIYLHAILICTTYSPTEEWMTDQWPKFRINGAREIKCNLCGGDDGDHDMQC